MAYPSIRTLVSPWFWQLILERKHGCRSPWSTVWCRFRNHPDGPIFYDPIGTEPDMRCINCGDLLG